MFERFTDDAQKLMQLANQHVQMYGHDLIATEHVLISLVKLSEGVGIVVLEQMGLNFEEIRAELDVMLRVKPPLTTARAIEVLEFAVQESRNLGHNYVGTEHILLGLLREDAAAQILGWFGIELEVARTQVRSTLGEP